MKIIFSQKCLEYQSPGHPESPQRVKAAYEFLKQKGYAFIGPKPCREEDILLAHSHELLAAIKNGRFFFIRFQFE